MGGKLASYGGDYGLLVAHEDELVHPFPSRENGSDVWYVKPPTTTQIRTNTNTIQIQPHNQANTDNPNKRTQRGYNNCLFLRWWLPGGCRRETNCQSDQ